MLCCDGLCKACKRRALHQSLVLVSPASVPLPQVPPSTGQVRGELHLAPTVASLLQHWLEVMHVLPQATLPVGQAALTMKGSAEC